MPTATAAPERLAALRATALLDSPAEPAFDRLTRLATRLLAAPVALVTLVDADRQFFKSCLGLPEPWASARETPLSHSFCRHAVELGEPLVIEDAREHPLVRDNLAIRDLGVIAYAGIPLVTSDGAALGSFCVIDHAPRRWTDDEVATLRDLAASAVTEIELRAALRAKDDFLALVGHELRSPLFGIASNAQMLAMGICGPVSERQAQALRRIDRSQRHLRGLVDQLLDLKRVAAGRMDYDPGPLAVDEVLGEAAALTETQLAEAELRLVHRPSPGLTAWADPERVRQVLVNLLSNAARFTPRGGEVTLSGEADDAWVRVRVRDTGVGIPADRREAVFEPFVQLRAGLAHAPGGTGLGLAISRELARGMGGDLTVESEPGVGSTFTLSLPRASG